MPRLVTTSVAARELGIGRSTLQRWVAEGRIQPDLVTLGGQYRWDVERVKAELRERRQRDTDD